EADETVDAGGDAAVGRRAVAECLDEMAEALLDVGFCVAQEGEDALLELGLVDANAAARQLDAVADEVVGARAHAPGGLFQQGQVFWRGRRERVMAAVPAIFLLVPVEER